MPLRARADGWGWRRAWPYRGTRVSDAWVSLFSTFYLLLVRYRTIDPFKVRYRTDNQIAISLPMIKPKILVTGATGRTGGAVVTQLLARGYPVRATVRVQDARSDLLQRRGAEVVLADIFDPGQLMEALRGVQRAYYCPPYHPFVIQSASALAVAARE